MKTIGIEFYKHPLCCLPVGEFFAAVCGNNLLSLLQGACSGCPSASVTLRDGIEKTLQEVWPDVKVEESAMPTRSDNENQTVDDSTVKKNLQALIEVVERMGGKISVTSSSKINEPT